MEDQTVSNARPAALPHGIQTLIFGVLAAIAAAFALMPGIANYVPYAIPYPIGPLGADSPAVIAGLFFAYQWYAISCALVFGVVSIAFGRSAHKEYLANKNQYSAQGYADMSAGSHTAYAALVAAVLIGFFALIW